MGWLDKDFVVMGIFLGIVLGCIGFSAFMSDRDEKRRKQEIRSAAMDYLSNHGGDTKGLAEFLVKAFPPMPYQFAELEAERSLAQYRKENPIIPEPSYEERHRGM